MKVAKKLFPIVLTVCLYFSLGILWHFVTSKGLVPKMFMPSPLEVWNTFLDISFGQGYKGYSLWSHLIISLYRIGVAFLLAALLAIPLGLLCGQNKTLRTMVSPMIHFYRPLPPLAYYTLLIIWMGIGDLSKIALLFFAGFAPIFLSCILAIEIMDPSRVIVARTLGASPVQVFLYVVLPSSLPEIFIGLRTAMGFIYTTLVAAEMVAAQSGIGWMVLDASKFLKSDVIFLGIIVMGLTGILIDMLFVGAEKLLIPWKGKGQ